MMLSSVVVIDGGLLMHRSSLKTEKLKTREEAGQFSMLAL
jgi:hypothetical protein